nr:MAG TPA: hypothetical protein [Caudoviricetes sp.]
MAVLISTGKATLHELKTVYDSEDAANLLEIIAVDQYNEQKANEWMSKNLS